ncbi:MAG: MCE family protein [Candidatus Electrothrix sp. AR4]|nr:MCE family protein [Candidatus Electrothrix sp. AR4]
MQDWQKLYGIIMNKFICFFVSALISIFLFGCLERDRTFQIQYENLQGLKKENIIYFQGNEIGRVQNISYRSQGDYLVEVRIKSDFKNAATVNSKFYINDDLIIDENKAVFVEQQQAGGTVIDRGAIVQGSVQEGILENVLSGFMQQIEVAGDSIQFNYEQLRESLLNTSQELSVQLDGALQDVSRQLDALNKKIQAVPDSEEVRKLEQSVKQLVDSLGKSREDIHNQVEKELVPALQSEIDQLRERLKQDGREEEINDVQKMVDEL